MIPRRCVLLGIATGLLAPPLSAQDAPCPVGRVPVEGRVLDLLTLQPVPDATVSAFTAEGGFAGSVPTEDEGRFVLCAVSGVDALLLRGYAADAVGPEAEVRPGLRGARQDVYVRLTEPASVRGRVVDATTGDAVEGLVLELSAARRSALTDRNGRFLIPNLPAGEHPVLLRHLAYGERADTLRVASGEEIEVSVLVEAAAIPIDPLTVITRRAPSEGERVGIRFGGLGRDAIDLLLPSTHSFPALLQKARVPGLSVTETTFAGDGIPALCVETGRRRGRRRVGDIGCYMVEVYVDDVRLVSPEVGLSALDPTMVDSLQIVPPVWAIGRYGGPKVHNGVLLIFTRRR